jgi:rhodanese-related sulfurtransferase
VRKITLETLLIIVLSAAAAFSVNTLRPGGLPLGKPESQATIDAPDPNADPNTVTPREAESRRRQENPLFLDARPPADYARGRIPGAVNFPVREFNRRIDDFFMEVDPEKSMIVYCSDAHCHLAEQLAQKLREAGFTNIHCMPAGIAGWKQAGFPVETEG